ncbi:MAG: lipase, partial [Clostridia bacterium]|nr:lipase [Clostridia bacterium]
VVTGPLSKGFFSLGNQAFVPVLPINKTRTTNTFYFLTGVDVLTEDACRTVICYGDSITAQSWADYLSLKCMENAYNKTAVIRRAASGTRVLREYTCITYESYGLSGEHRFEREISTVSGADAVIIQQGINDIIHPVGTDINPFRPMSDLPSAEELEAGIQKYVDFAKSRGLRVYLGTLLPIYGWRTYAPFREEMKNAFNEWVRAHKGIDGYIDFDKALRDGKNTAAFKSEYNSGDNLHPSESAYKKMAEAAYGVIK